MGDTRLEAELAGFQQLGVDAAMRVQCVFHNQGAWANDTRQKTFCHASRIGVVRGFKETLRPDSVAVGERGNRNQCDSDPITKLNFGICKNIKQIPKVEFRDL
jgi:hypothetical protein